MEKIETRPIYAVTSTNDDYYGSWKVNLAFFSSEHHAKEFMKTLDNAEAEMEEYLLDEFAARAVTVHVSRVYLNTGKFKDMKPVVMLDTAMGECGFNSDGWRVVVTDKGIRPVHYRVDAWSSVSQDHATALAASSRASWAEEHGL